MPDSDPSIERPEGLRVYLLGTVEFDAIVRLQRRLVYDVSGERSHGALILAEHPAVISIGRDGSRDHIRFDERELSARGWPIRYVNRGGGCLLQCPGQIAAYSIVALDRLGIDLGDYVERLHAAVLDVTEDLDIRGETRRGRGGVWVGDRLLAHIGIAVRDWVSYFGIALNVRPDLQAFGRVDCARPGEPPMTSVERELRTCVRMSTIRQRLIEGLARSLGFGRTTLFHSHGELAGSVDERAATLRRA